MLDTTDGRGKDKAVAQSLLIYRRMRSVPLYTSPRKPTRVSRTHHVNLHYIPQGQFCFTAADWTPSRLDPNGHPVVVTSCRTPPTIASTSPLHAFPWPTLQAPFLSLPTQTTDPSDPTIAAATIALYFALYMLSLPVILHTRLGRYRVRKFNNLNKKIN